jgi:hypothetical protein
MGVQAFNNTTIKRMEIFIFFGNVHKNLGLLEK